MIIEHLKWQNVIIKHITNKKDYKDKIVNIEFASIVLDMNDKRLDIMEYHPWKENVQNHLYMNPKLIKLTTKEIELEAEWWGTKFPAKGPPKRMKNHKVKITGKF